jgi:hypothetical protein
MKFSTFKSGSEIKHHTRRCMDDHLAIKMMLSEAAHAEEKRRSTCTKQQRGKA